MNMFHERTWSVTVHVDGLCGDAELHSRFASNGNARFLSLIPESSIEAALKSRGALVGSVECDGNWFDSVKWYILGPLGSSNRMELEHTLLMHSPTGNWVAKKLVEVMRLENEPAAGEDWSDVDAYSQIYLEGQEVNAVVTDDPLGDIFRKNGVLLRACATCRNGTVPGIGGDDYRHGLYCFRGIERPNGKWSVQDERWKGALSGVDAFYSCPQYEIAVLPH